MAKLWRKTTRAVNPVAEPLLLGHLGFMALTGALIVGGVDLLFTIFVFVLAAVCLVLAASSADSPYSATGAQRELVLLLAAEPFFIVLLAAICKLTGESTLAGVLASPVRVAISLPGILAGFLLIVMLKLRKSPFDISTSHHAHQELVKGLTSDLSGRLLAYVEVAHWYETVISWAVSSRCSSTGACRWGSPAQPCRTGWRSWWTTRRPGRAGRCSSRRCGRPPSSSLAVTSSRCTSGDAMAIFKRSAWLLHYDGSSCNGCDIEVVACLTPLYDVERFGVLNTGNPKHADILLITGGVNDRNVEVVQNLYRQMPDPKVVIAVGACASLGRRLRPGLQHSRRHRSGDPRRRLRARLRGQATEHHRGRAQGGRAPRGQSTEERVMDAKAFLERVRTFESDGYRLLMINATALAPSSSSATSDDDDDDDDDGAVELTWSFEKGGRLEHLREQVKLDEEVPSVAPIYSSRRTSTRTRCASCSA